MSATRVAFIGFAGLAVFGCSDGQSPPANQPAASATGAQALVRAELRDAQGQSKGSATATQAGNGIAIRLDATGMPEGTYAAHVHTTGVCEAPKFTTAGGHWNPASRQHGKDNPAGMHKGDLDNLTIGGGGQGSLEFTIAEAALSGGASAMLDGDGAAIMIHAKPDDYRTDPTGDAGDRIACGVFGQGS